VGALKSFYSERIRPALRKTAERIGDFLEEATFRLRLAWAVLAGRVPLEVKRRWWNRAVERPVLVDAYDWTTDRLIFSLLVWPPLDAPAHTALYDHDERTRQVKESFGRVCADRAWGVRFETDYGLRWDHARQVWTDSSEAGYAYDGERFGSYARTRAGGAGMPRNA
jgi:hypothetical protein